MLEYLTSDGDTADFIAWRHYGTTEHLVVERLLEANKGLADMGAVLPAGVLVKLPQIEIAREVRGVKLWD